MRAIAIMVVLAGCYRTGGPACPRVPALQAPPAPAGSTCPTRFTTGE